MISDIVFSCSLKKLICLWVRGTDAVLECLLFIFFGVNKVMVKWDWKHNEMKTETSFMHYGFPVKVWIFYGRMHLFYCAPLVWLNVDFGRIEVFLIFGLQNNRNLPV
ncbi:hypothetical protein J1N35_030845 [Gossypium stocksii]|uniref:Uncharacterized protein n=1 Tax=Gossypium stocksii TaxID=47602 RepID=A0A9D3ZUA5_9ROSI|nr:hypothetical protein J1N35_030845 [Gossypium stocksii]